VYVEQVEREHAAKAATQTPAATLPPSTPPEKTPLYKKWWFWTLVGGAAGLVAVGTAIGVSSREPDLTNVMQYRPFTQ
jgi:hypothetical protein